MKCTELSAVFERLGRVYASTGHRVPNELTTLRGLLDTFPDATVAQLAKRISALRPQPVTSDQSVSGLLNLVEAANHLFTGLGKASVTKDLTALSVSLAKHLQADAGDLVLTLGSPAQLPGKSPPAAARSEVVQKYLRALEQALGDETGFASVFGSLERDTDVGAAELTALARRFASASVKSRSAALKKIWARHQALMVSRAKAAATAGRIAG